ncbi:hypothetical protein CEXT_368761 [Caerostris extrusa]|uniref:Uncharacterized protein n=1 Tax=Caerostris extrusa TaxID=172846 RepID=A0AAV4Q9A7_CAEEX|nr:hypothetical protein CEXT_368761 [Caerostris extrusa]
MWRHDPVVSRLQNSMINSYEDSLFSFIVPRHSPQKVRPLPGEEECSFHRSPDSITRGSTTTPLPFHYSPYPYPHPSCEPSIESCHISYLFPVSMRRPRKNTKARLFHTPPPTHPSLFHQGGWKQTIFS